jgi:NRAMP (natural resistance-associated macrophage protein)-like metal ion transporter
MTDEAELRSTPRLGPKRLAGILGPGLVTGASDDDPSGIATYAQAGAQFQNRSLWTVLLCLPLMITVQEICDRTALATDKNLGELVHEKFSRASRMIVMVLLIALMAANLVNIAADLMAVGQGFSLLHWGSPAIWSLAAGLVILALVAVGSFDAVSRVFRVLCLSLLAYPAVLITVHADWSQVLRGSVGLAGAGSSDFWKIVVAILGTTISPYLFFWQSAHRVEDIDEREQEGEAAELDDEPDRRGARRRLAQSRLDVVTGMVFSEIVAFAIIAGTAATLGTKHTSVGSAADAAKALEPVAGSWAAILFAAGFIGSGFLAVPVLAGSASTAIAGMTGRAWGFSRSPKQAPLYYVLVAMGTVGGTLLSVFYTDPIGLLVFSALVNGIAAAPFLLVAMLIGRDRRIMGEHRLGRLSATVGWLTTAIMAAAGVVGILTL